MVYCQFVLVVEVELVEGQYQVVVYFGIIEYVGMFGSYVQVYLVVVVQWVDIDVDQQQDVFELMWLQQVGVVYGCQGDWQELLQVVQEIVQFGIVEVVLVGMQGQLGGVVDDVVVMVLGEQFDQFEVVFQWCVVRLLVSVQGIGEDCLLCLFVVVVGGQLDQGQDVFVEIWGDFWVDVFYFVCFVFEGGIQVVVEQVQVVVVDVVVSVLLVGDLEQQVVVVGQFVDYCVMFFYYLVYFLLVVVVEQG